MEPVEGLATFTCGEPMKVCMLAYAHYINDARIKCYVRTLEDNGHQVDVIVLRSAGESKTEALRTGTISRIMNKYQGESTLMYSWSYLAFFLKALFLLAGRSFSTRYDVVHIHNMPNILVYAAIVPKILGARLILDVHDLMTVNYMAKFGSNENDLPVQVLKFEQKFSAWFADHMICADHNQKEYLVSSCGVARHKIDVLLNLPNAELFGLRPAQKPRETNAFRIVYHGTIAQRLGIDLIVRAVAKVVDQIPAELWMYGRGDFLPDAMALASELGLGDRAHFSKSFFPVEKIP